MKKERIDKLLHELGLAESRSKAHSLIMAGLVLVNEQRVDKPSQEFLPTDKIRIKGDSEATRYVGRGGLKLEKAIEEFSVDVTGLTCLDIGASTGGFTDCLLQYGSASIVAIDSGTNQMAWKLRNDPRVDVRENTNARHLESKDFDSKFDLIVMDVSFISVTKIIPALVPLLKDTGKTIILIKPQFEVGKGEVGKGGIVKDEQKHKEVIEKVNAFALSVGLEPLGLIDSPILGAEGNKEFLGLYERQREG